MNVKGVLNGTCANSVPSVGVLLFPRQGTGPYDQGHYGFKYGI